MDILSLFASIPVFSVDILEAWGVTFDKSGGIKNTLQNLYILLQADEVTHNKLKYNLLSGSINYISNINYWNRLNANFTDTDLNYIALRLEMGYQLRPSEKTLISAIDTVAHENSYHPIRELLSQYAKNWDGKSRVADFFPMWLKAEASDLLTEITKVMMWGIIARVFESGVKFDYMPVIIDTSEGTGKSTICEFLALSPEYFTSDVGDITKKEALENIRGKLIVEMGELKALQSKHVSIEDIKQFLSKTVDTYRPSYGRYTVDYPRQCVFIGTSNNPESLPQDEGGNRRFLPIFCHGTQNVNLCRIHEKECKEYIRQLYGELTTSYFKGEYHLIIAPEYVEEMQKQIELATPENECIAIIESYADENKLDYLCVSQIKNDILICNTPVEKNKAIKLLKTGASKCWKYCGDKKHTFPKYGRARYFERVESWIESQNDCPF